MMGLFMVAIVALAGTAFSTVLDGQERPDPPGQACALTVDGCSRAQLVPPANPPERPPASPGSSSRGSARTPGTAASASPAPPSGGGSTPETYPRPRPGTGSYADVYISDLTFERASNGWGPVERDRSNGEEHRGDGGPLRIAGVGYRRGLGVHADSDVRIVLPGYCPTLRARIGIDDEGDPNGNPQAAQVQFVVLGDGREVYRSGTRRWGQPALLLDLDTSGFHTVTLRVDGLGFVGHDHADWADAKLRCHRP